MGGLPPVNANPQVPLFLRATLALMGVSLARLSGTRACEEDCVHAYDHLLMARIGVHLIRSALLASAAGQRFQGCPNRFPPLVLNSSKVKESA